MSSPVIIGVDAGTSVIKAVAFDLQGHQLASACTPNHIHHGAGGRVEQDLQQVWNDTAATLRALADRVPDLAQRAVALTATAQGDGTWLIDAHGEPVGPGLLWLDGRAAPQVAALRHGPAAQALAERTGTALNPSMQSGQLLWLRAHEPERLQRATSALHCKDWLYFKATGERRTCHAEAVFTFGNHRSGDYDDEVLRLLGLSELRHLLPVIGIPGHEQAPLTPEAAVQCGLRAGLPVVLAPMDVPASVLGAGGVAYGPAGLRSVGCSVLGSTGMHGWAIKGAEGVRANAEAGYTMLLPLPGIRMRLMSHMAATLNIDWLLALLTEAMQLGGAPALARAPLLDKLNDMVLGAAPGQAIFHPYIADNGERGPFVDPHARAQLSGFGSGLGLPGLARAVFEGVALATRDCYTALGPVPQEVRLSGGAARSPALRQLLANVLNRPIRLSLREECGAAGAAMVASVALGQHACVRDALPEWVDTYLADSTTQPDTGEVTLYDQLFPIYQEMAARARTPWSQLAAARSTADTLTPAGPIA